jgi:hypothetical protein
MGFLMGFLICEKCGSYYELRKNESPEDFDLICEFCGGNLQYKPVLSPDINLKSSKFGFFHTEKISSKYAIIIVGGVFLIFFSFLELIYGGDYLFLLFILVGFVLSVYGWYKGNSWIKGAKGEKVVAKYLKELPSGYSYFNYVVLPSQWGNIDHIVIGSNGIFVLETKNYGGFYVVDGHKWSYQIGPLPIYRPMKSPGKQAKSNAIALRNYLSSEGVDMTGIWVTSIVAFLSMKIVRKKDPPNYEIIHPSKLVQFITNKNGKLEENIKQKSIELIEKHSASYKEL